MTNIVGIVQARMGSTRFKNKSMAYFNGYPIVYWLLKRGLKSKKINKLIFAIPNTEDNDILEIYLKKFKVGIYRGDEFDLVKRYLNAAKKFNASHIVRICADNPLISGKEIDILINKYFQLKPDYIFNHMSYCKWEKSKKKIFTNSYPDGLGAEMCSVELMKIIDKKSKKKSHREHIFNYLFEAKENYKICTFNPPDKKIRFPKIKLDFDSYTDYINLLKKPYKINMSSRNIVNLYLNKKI